jgi:hypothetical protein
MTSKRWGSGCKNSPGVWSVGAWRMVCEEPDSPSVLRVHCEFLRVFCSILFVGGFLVHEVHGRSVLECQTIRVGADGLWVHRGRSVIEGAVLEIRWLFLDSPPQTRGRSAWATWTVRLELANGSRGTLQSC